MYSCVPAAYFPTPSLSYWAQAAALAGFPTTEPSLTPVSLSLGIKKAQLPLNISDVIQKSRSAASLRSSEDVPSSFRVTPRLSPSTVLDTHHRQAQLHHHHQVQQQHHHGAHHSGHFVRHRPFSTSSPPVGNGLAPLQALCDSDVTAFAAKFTSASGSAATSQPGAGNSDEKSSLKFGMSRILSDDFGKTKNEKENQFRLSAVPESCRSLTLCPCNSPTCTAYTHPPSPYSRGRLPSLSAVHALQPPHYPHNGSADALPGPYSVLSADGASSGQSKRKRSWSRAVFSNLQRKGLEKRFEVQKYVTKPDRRQLAAMLGLTDAQVKVWFQNRRMKWRHAQQQSEKDLQIRQQQQPQQQQQLSSTENNKVLGGKDTVSVCVETASGDENESEVAAAGHYQVDGSRTPCNSTSAGDIEPPGIMAEVSNKSNGKGFDSGVEECSEAVEPDLVSAHSHRNLISPSSDALLEQDRVGCPQSPRGDNSRRGYGDSVSSGCDRSTDETGHTMYKNKKLLMNDGRRNGTFKHRMDNTILRMSTECIGEDDDDDDDGNNGSHSDLEIDDEIGMNDDDVYGNSDENDSFCYKSIGGHLRNSCLTVTHGTVSDEESMDEKIDVDN